MNQTRATKELVDIVLLASRGSLREALTKLDQQRFTGSLELPALLLRAQLLEQVDTEECWRTYTSGFEKFPDDAALTLRAGVFVYKRGDLVRAEELLMRSWKRQPLPETGYYLGSIYSIQLQTEKAQEYFVQTVTLEGDGGYWRKQAQQKLQSN